MAYFKLTETKQALEVLDGWIRRKLRCILWRQWKRPYTRAKNLIKAGLKEERAWRSACNQRGPWWNSGASHMNQAFPKSFFDRLGLVSLLDTPRCQDRCRLPLGGCVGGWGITDPGLCALRGQPGRSPKGD